jgi:hypothetical protein
MKNQIKVFGLDNLVNKKIIFWGCAKKDCPICPDAEDCYLRPFYSKKIIIKKVLNVYKYYDGDRELGEVVPSDIITADTGKWDKLKERMLCQKG